MRVIDLTGEKFGRLVVQQRAPNRGKITMWKCLCECGRETTVASQPLRDGRTRSCGCLSLQMSIERRTTHGEALKYSRTPEYRAWAGIKRRCFSPTHRDYPAYGGRGITVCAEWKDDYAAFLRDMGRKPSPRHSIDRVNSELGYTPSNCRWATSTVQGRNRRGVKITEDIAADIRSSKASGARRKDTCARLGISVAIYKQVNRGKTWRPDA